MGKTTEMRYSVGDDDACYEAHCTKLAEARDHARRLRRRKPQANIRIGRRDCSSWSGYFEIVETV